MYGGYNTEVWEHFLCFGLIILSQNHCGVVHEWVLNHLLDLVATIVRNTKVG
jgi:hypothetical protein